MLNALHPVISQIPEADVTICEIPTKYVTNSFLYIFPSSYDEMSYHFLISLQYSGPINNISAEQLPHLLWLNVLPG